MAGKRGRPASFQRRILAVLREHHQAAGWDAPLPRGELLARLQGWGYGRQLTRRGGDPDAAVLVAYTGVAREGANDTAYQNAQKLLTRTLRVLYGRGLVRLGSRRGQLHDAAAHICEMAADLAAPEAAYQRFLAAGLQGTRDEFLARRRGTLAAWQAGRGRPFFPVHLVALTPEGRAEAERQAGNNDDFSAAARTRQKSRAR